MPFFGARLVSGQILKQGYAVYMNLILHHCMNFLRGGILGGWCTMRAYIFPPSH